MACEGKSFTFIWELENASYCLQNAGAAITSPSFVVNSIDETKWHLGLYPRGKESDNNIRFYLYRDVDQKAADQVEIKFELAFLADDGTVLSSENIVKFAFQRNESYGFSQFVKREDVFSTKRFLFLTKDTLTARCRIWKSVGEMPEDVKCCARTRIGVQKRSILWSIKNFSALEYRRKYTYELKSLSDDKLVMSLNTSLTYGINSDDVICFDLSLHDRAIKFSTLRLSLIDACRNKIECNREEFWFHDGTKSQGFNFVITKDILVAMKSSYLPGDILTLHWEWVFSKGVVSEEIDSFEFTNFSSGSKFSDTQSVNNQKMVPLLYFSNSSLKTLYDENFLCDVELKTNTHTFNAHKVILSAASSVFKAMFSSNMTEKSSNCVNIEDLSDDSVSQLLIFIYSAHVEDLTWDRAYNLYIAADKYAIFSLKNICSSYLMDNLSPSNACEVLMLSEFHADKYLKSSVQNYVLKNAKDIVNSDHWKLLMETNLKLAAETLCLQHKLNL